LIQLCSDPGPQDFNPGSEILEVIAKIVICSIGICSIGIYSWRPLKIRNLPVKHHYRSFLSQIAADGSRNKQ